MQSKTQTSWRRYREELQSNMLQCTEKSRIIQRRHQWRHFNTFLKFLFTVPNENWFSLPQTRQATTHMYTFSTKKTKRERESLKNSYLCFLHVGNRPPPLTARPPLTAPLVCNVHINRTPPPPPCSTEYLQQGLATDLMTNFYSLLSSPLYIYGKIFLKGLGLWRPI